MPNPSRSLSCLLSWPEVVPALGILGTSPKLLTQKVRCPVCTTDRFQVHIDHQLGGHWCACTACKFMGDPIELAARLWKCDIPVACGKLESLGLFSEPISAEQIAAYERDHVLYRRRLADFWAKAQRAALVPSASFGCLLQAFGLLRILGKPHWPGTAGHIIEMASRQEIETLFAPESYADQPRKNRDGRISVRRGGGPGGRKLFHGTGWEDCIVVPFFDLPGRLSGLLFLGCSSDSQVRNICWTFKRANLGCCSQPVREAGLAMLSTLDDPSYALKDKVFVVDDFAVALILQARWLVEHDRLLPIVLAHYSPTVQTLNLPDQLRDRQVVLWGTSPGIFRLAKASGGAVSNYRISASEIKSRLSHNDPCSWLRLIESKARHWSRVLQEELRGLDPSSCEVLLKTVGFSAPEMRSFVQDCDPELQAKLVAAEPYRICHQKVTIGKTSIIETQDGWQVERTGERISNFAVRVEEVFTTGAKGSFYRGTATAGEKRHEFTLSTEAVDKRGLLPCVRDYLLERQQGLLLFNPRWAKRSALIAFSFHEPKLIKDADRVGWDANRSCFLFPKFAIERGGALLTDLSPVAIDEQTPGRDLEPPSALEVFPRTNALATHSPESAIAWSTIVAVLHNVVSATQLRRPHGIVLDGEPAQSAGGVTARALGCIETTISRQRHVSLLEQIYGACHRHDWPTIIRFPEGANIHVASAWLDQPAVHNAILSVGRLAGLGIAAHPGFVRIHSPVPLGPLGDMQRMISAIVPAYILDLCRRKLWIDHKADHHVYDLLADVAEWWGRVGGDAKTVLRARQFLHVDSLNPWANFLEVILHLFDEGLIAVHWDHRHRKCPVVVYQDATETCRSAVWQPALQINDILASRHAPALDLPSLEAFLRKESVWLGIELFQGDEMWMLDREWFDAEVKKRRRRQQRSTIAADEKGAAQAGATFAEQAPGDGGSVQNLASSATCS